MKTLSKLQQLSFIIRREFLAISTSYAVLLVLMGGIFVCGLLYNYMYAPTIVTDVPVAVVYLEALQGASSRVMLAINDKYRPDEAVFLPPQGLLAVAMAKPINVEGTALYNYTEGYGSYLIPAVMMSRLDSLPQKSTYP